MDLLLIGVTTLLVLGAIVWIRKSASDSEEDKAERKTFDVSAKNSSNAVAAECVAQAKTEIPIPVPKKEKKPPKVSKAKVVASVAVPDVPVPVAKKPRKSRKSKE